MYTKEELGFILYNNRSVKGAVNNFIPNDINPFRLIKIEKDFESCKSILSNNKKMVEINIDELDVESNDININPNQLEELTSLFKENIGKFDKVELDYLTNRGIKEDIILKWSLLGLSNIKDSKSLEIIGATCHPILRKILIDGIENGGILIPLFKDDKLVNCAVRKINSSKSLKYSLACPDVPVWGLDKLVKGDEVWITEGLFDMMAIEEMFEKSVSCSSAMWSGLQLYQLLQKKPSKINIFSDNDEVGLRTSGILKIFFEMNNIDCKIFISNFAKDPAEHYFQKGKDLSHLTEIDNVENLIENKSDNSFDFIKHMVNRNY
jgi:hypothetical protein